LSSIHDQDTIDTLIDHLQSQGSTEAHLVAELLETLDIPDDLQVPPTSFMITCLDELIGWAMQAQMALRRCVR